MSSKKVFQKLIRTPRSNRKKILLSEREYYDLATTSFEDYQRKNFNAEQLQLLSAAETDQLETYYQLLEKKLERTQKKIRDKRQPELVPPVVIRYVPAPTELEPRALGLPPIPDPEVAQEDDNDPRQVLDDIEKSVDFASLQQQQQQSPRRLTDEIQRAVDDLDVSLNMIDLSKALPPKELLLEESHMREPTVDESIEEIDLGPPGDAGAFLGVDNPMPLSDVDVLNQLLQEFPSLRRPDVGGRFEDLDEMALPEIELMPPPPGTGISFSTPIAGIPTAAVAGIPDRFRRLYNTDLSAIKGPTPTVTVAALTEDDTSIQVEHINKEKTGAEEVPPQIEHGSTEPEERTSEQIQITEPITSTLSEQPELGDVVPLASVSASTESSSSVERPRNIRKSHKKVPTYGPSAVIVRMKLRTNFEFDCGYGDLEKYDPIRSLIQWILDLSRDRTIPLQPLPADIEGQPVLRDISITQAELSSIREQNQSRLFPIQERPQQEELAEQQLQHVSLPVPYAETVEHSIAVPVVPPCPTLPEVSLGDTNLILDTGLGNQTMFQDISTSLTRPHVVITDSSTDNGTRLYRETPGIEKPEFERPIAREKEAQVQTAAMSGQDESAAKPVEKLAEGTVNISTSKEVLGSAMKLYLTIQREIAITKRNSFPIGSLSQITSIDRVASAKRFLNLLRLKKWGFIEIEIDSESYVQSISLRRM